ncbi:dipeptide/oligopeptide/nickel ABC transporter permease/ATP-binding protein [Micromonospora sp. HM134]|nr:dipeptide/oligopeptide/nickel ABC transporter permease/ATP-binding protein [Micromonospora sp. HM134]
MTASGAGRRRRTVICALPLLGFVIAGALAPVIAPYDPIANDLMASLARPSMEHLLGTDQLGRDQLSRLLYGAQASLILAAAVLAVSVTVGVVIGAAGGFLGGWPDRVALWLMDVTLTLPSLIVALAILGVRGHGSANLVLALSLTGWPPFARLARGRFVSLRRSTYFDALQVLGASRFRILFQHALPALAAPVLVYASIEIGFIVLSLAFLSFLGLGIPPPEPEWGQMLIDARPYLDSALWLALPPGLAIAAVVLASNLLAEQFATDNLPLVRLGMPRRRARMNGSTAGPYRVEELAVAFAGRKVVDGIDYRVAPGRALAIVGESGSGKTLSTLAPLGLVDATARVSGRAVLGQVDLLGGGPAIQEAVRGRRVGVVLQDARGALNPVRTVGALLDDAVRHAGVVPRGRERARSLELLKMVGLPEPESQVYAYPHTLSGGMCQRVMIALALAGEPEILIADEPTSALDVTTQAQIHALLADLRESIGMGLILISHDIAAAARIADDIAVCYAGRIVEVGPAADVVSRPDHPYTRGLLDAVPSPKAVPGTRFRTLPPAEPARRKVGACAFAPRCAHATKRCHVEEPPLQPVTPGHTSACWVRPTVARPIGYDGA